MEGDRPPLAGHREGDCLLFDNEAQLEHWKDGRWEERLVAVEFPLLVLVLVRGSFGLVPR